MGGNNNEVHKSNKNLMLGGNESAQAQNKRNQNNLSTNQSNNDQDDYFEEPQHQRAIPQFLMNLPGVVASDSMGYRIEALRVYLETQLGDIPFLAAYKHLINLSGDDDTTNDELEGILGPKKMKFLTLIH
jgi:hypothetical protein